MGAQTERAGTRRREHRIITRDKATEIYRLGPKLDTLEGQCSKSIGDHYLVLCQVGRTAEGIRWCPYCDGWTPSEILDP